MAWRSSSASVWMSGVHFTLAARLSRLPLASAGMVAALVSAPQAASASAAVAPATASIGRVNLICRSSGRPVKSMAQRTPAGGRLLRYGSGAPGAQIHGARLYACAKVTPVNQDWEDRVTAA